MGTSWSRRCPPPRSAVSAGADRLGCGRRGGPASRRAGSRWPGHPCSSAMSAAPNTALTTLRVSSGPGASPSETSTSCQVTPTTLRAGSATPLPVRRTCADREPRLDGPARARRRARTGPDQLWPGSSWVRLVGQALGRKLGEPRENHAVARAVAEPVRWGWPAGQGRPAALIQTGAAPFAFRPDGPASLPHPGGTGCPVPAERSFQTWSAS
jgi:hypothetical protein